MDHRLRGGQGTDRAPGGLCLAAAGGAERPPCERPAKRARPVGGAGCGAVPGGRRPCPARAGRGRRRPGRCWEPSPAALSQRTPSTSPPPALRTSPGARPSRPCRGDRGTHQQPGRAFLLQRQAQAAPPPRPRPPRPRHAGPAGTGCPSLQPARSALRQDPVRHSRGTAPRVCQAGAIGRCHGPASPGPLQPGLQLAPPHPSVGNRTSARSNCLPPRFPPTPSKPLKAHRSQLNSDAVAPIGLLSARRSPSGNPGIPSAWRLCAGPRSVGVRRIRGPLR